MPVFEELHCANEEVKLFKALGSSNIGHEKSLQVTSEVWKLLQNKLNQRELNSFIASIFDSPNLKIYQGPNGLPVDVVVTDTTIFLTANKSELY